MMSGGGAEEGEMSALAGSFSFLPISQPPKLEINLLRCLQKTPVLQILTAFLSTYIPCV